jgi:hypothetical protein
MAARAARGHQAPPHLVPRRTLAVDSAGQIAGKGHRSVTTQPTLAPGAFAAKWRGVTTTEKAASQEHFIDLCRMLGEPTPHEADPTGEHYAFEKRVSKAAGGDGFADAWKRDFFAWEYKGKDKDLRAAYVQLMGYKDDLGNPPLLVVSDLERIEIHTNFTGLSPIVKVVTLDDLAADARFIQLLTTTHYA